MFLRVASFVCTAFATAHALSISADQGAESNLTVVKLSDYDARLDVLKIVEVPNGSTLANVKVKIAKAVIPGLGAMPVIASGVVNGLEFYTSDGIHKLADDSIIDGEVLVRLKGN